MRRCSAIIVVSVATFTSLVSNATRCSLLSVSCYDKWQSSVVNNNWNCRDCKCVSGILNYMYRPIIISSLFARCRLSAGNVNAHSNFTMCVFIALIIVGRESGTYKYTSGVEIVYDCNSLLFVVRIVVILWIIERPNCRSIVAYTCEIAINERFA